MIRRLLFPVLLMALALVGGHALAQTFGTGWSVQFFNNTEFSGTPVLSQVLPSGVNFNWGFGSPATGVEVDNWSARFQSVQQFNAGTYEFIIAADDRARVFIDGQQVFERLSGGPLWTERFQYTFAAGGHTILIEFVEITGEAALQFQWVQLGAGTPGFTGTPQPTVFTTFTPFPSATPLSCSAPLNFQIGQYVLLDPGVFVRSQPTLSGPQVNYYTEEKRLRITNGPVCADGYNWWRVAGVGEPGWVAEGTPERYFLALAAQPIDPEFICSQPLPIVPGETITLLTGLRVRETPEAQGRVLTVMPFESQLEVLDGPVCANRVNWWQVRAPIGSASVDGWVSEGYPEEYFIQSNTPPTAVPLRCGRPLTLPPGSRAAVTYRDAIPRTLRSAPSASSTPVTSLLAGIALEIISGPVCAEGYNWYEVNVLTTSLRGWIAEGRPGNYWLEPFADGAVG
jgi:hypothetical protein